jgi:hypothetical protein
LALGRGAAIDASGDVAINQKKAADRLRREGDVGADPEQTGQCLIWGALSIILLREQDGMLLLANTSLIPAPCRRSAYRRIDQFVSQSEHAMSVGEPGDWKFAEVHPVVVASPGKGS